DKAIVLKPDYLRAHDSREIVRQDLTRSGAAMSELNKLQNINFIPATNMVTGSAFLSQSIERLPNSARMYKYPIPVGFESYYADYRYTPSRFSKNDIVAIDGRDIRVVDRISEPEVVIFENILSDIECELLINLSRPKLQRSPTYDRES